MTKVCRFQLYSVATTSQIYGFILSPTSRLVPEAQYTYCQRKETTRTEVYTLPTIHADRISKVQHSLGGASITLYDAPLYDNFGRLLTKQYHGTSIQSS